MILHLNRPDDDQEKSIEDDSTMVERKKHTLGELMKMSNPTNPSVRKRRDKKIIGLKDAAAIESQFQSALALEEEEQKVKKSVSRSPFWLMLIGLYAALKVFAFFLLTLETMVVLVLTIGLTLFWYYEYGPLDGWGAGYMDWFIIGFAIVGPMSASLTMSFNRREGALMRLSQFRSFANHIYLAHVLWDWDDGKGRAASGIDWVSHTDKVMAQLIGMADELSRFLRLPTATRSRHRMTKSGREEAARIMRVGYQLYESLSIQRLNRLSEYGERIKAAGLGASEVSRIRQYERWIGETIESLRQVKLYRTPQTLRSFARIFTIILPPFYAPTFAALAIEVKSLAVGIIMSIVLTMALMGLYESIQVMEDPFVAYRALDGIDVREELEVLLWDQMVETRRHFYPDAPPYPEAPRHPILKKKLEHQRMKVASTHPPESGVDSSAAVIPTAASVHDDDIELGLLQERDLGHHRAKTFEIEELALLMNAANEIQDHNAPPSLIGMNGGASNKGSSLRLYSSEGGPIGD